MTAGILFGVGAKVVLTFGLGVLGAGSVASLDFVSAEVRVRPELSLAIEGGRYDAQYGVGLGTELSTVVFALKLGQNERSPQLEFTVGLGGVLPWISDGYLIDLVPFASGPLTDFAPKSLVGEAPTRSPRLPPAEGDPVDALEVTVSEIVIGSRFRCLFKRSSSEVDVPLASHVDVAIELDRGNGEPIEVYVPKTIADLERTLAQGELTIDALPLFADALDFVADVSGVGEVAQGVRARVLVVIEEKPERYGRTDWMTIRR